MSTAALEDGLRFSAARLEESNALGTFFGRLAALEQQHAEALYRLVRASSPKVEREKSAGPQPVSAVLESALDAAAQQAQRHARIAEQLGGPICTVLRDETKRCADARRSTEADSQRALKSLQEVQAALRSRNEAFHAAEKVASEEVAKLERVLNTPRAKEKERNKAREKSEASAARLSVASDALARTETLAAETQQVLYDTWLPKLLGALERQEEKRARSVLDAGVRLGALLDASVVSGQQSSVMLGAALENVDVGASLREMRAATSRERGRLDLAAAEIRQPLRKARAAVAVLAHGKPIGSVQWRRRLVVLTEYPFGRLATAGDARASTVTSTSTSGRRSADDNNNNGDDDDEAGEGAGEEAAGEEGAGEEAGEAAGESRREKEADPWAPTLFVYRGEDSSSPEEAIPLRESGAAVARLRALDESVLWRPHTLELEQLPPGPLYVSDQQGGGCVLLMQLVDEAEQHDWQHALALLLSGKRSHLGGVPAPLLHAPSAFPSMRVVSVTIFEAKRLPKAGEFSCRLLVDDVIFGQTMVARGGPESSAVWAATQADFRFERVPLDAQELTIVLTARSGASAMSQVFGMNGDGGVSGGLPLRGAPLRPAAEEWALSIELEGLEGEVKDQWHAFLSAAEAEGDSSRGAGGEGGGSSVRSSSGLGRRAARTLASPGSTPPSVRLRASCEHMLLRPTRMYAGLISALVGCPACVAAMLDAATPPERTGLAEQILSVLSAHDTQPARAQSAVHTLIDGEVACAAGNETLLFRSNSGVTKLLEAYTRRVASAYMRATLGPCVLRILDEKKPCEVDPAKCPDPSEIRRNMQRLMGHVTDLWSVIVASAASCPLPLRALLARVRESCDTDSRFAGDSAGASRGSLRDHVSVKACSGVFFLRFLLPGLLSPLSSGLTSEPPSEPAARTLLLVSKVLISLANLVEFGRKEPFMEPLNGFIRPNLPGAAKFIFDLATPPPSDADEELSSTPALSRLRGVSVAAGGHKRLSLAQAAKRVSVSLAAGRQLGGSSSTADGGGELVEGRLAASLASLFAFLRRRSMKVLESAEGRGCIDGARALFEAHHSVNPHADDPLESWKPRAPASEPPPEGGGEVTPVVSAGEGSSAPPARPVESEASAVAQGLTITRAADPLDGAGGGRPGHNYAGKSTQRHSFVSDSM
jgi:hypothetical protein